MFSWSWPYSFLYVTEIGLKSWKGHIDKSQELRKNKFLHNSKPNSSYFPSVYCLVYWQITAFFSVSYKSVQSYKANKTFSLNSGILGSSHFSSMEMHVKIHALFVLLINNGKHNSFLKEKKIVLDWAWILFKTVQVLNCWHSFTDHVNVLRKRSFESLWNFQTYTLWDRILRNCGFFFSLGAVPAAVSKVSRVATSSVILILTANSHLLFTQIFVSANYWSN